MTIKRKVVVIGVGHVGSHVISSLVTRGICTEVIGIDKDKDKVTGHIRDIADTIPYMNSKCIVKVGDYSELTDADVLVISVSGKFFEENRLEELDDSVKIIDEIAPKIEKSGFHGIVIVITNPCDLVAYYLNMKLSVPVIASGTALDSARLKARVAEKLQISPDSIQGYCLGEHGDSQVIPWSQVTLQGKPVDRLLKPEEIKEIEHDTIFAGWKIAVDKGSTEFGIGTAASELIKCIFNDEHKVIPCSVLLHGLYDQSDCYASVPCIVSSMGASPLPEHSLTEEEKRKFSESCQLMKNYINKKL